MAVHSRPRCALVRTVVLSCSALLLWSVPAHADISGAPSEAVRLELTVPKREMYLHERVPLDLTLSVGSAHVADLEYPTLPADGFWVEPFADPNRGRQVIDGEFVQTLRFHTTVTPLRAGSLTLGPATLQLTVFQRRRGHTLFGDSFFDRFFQGDPFDRFFQNDLFFVQRRSLDVRSTPISLTIFPLPEEGKPAAFSGAVGTFTLQVTAAPTELNVGDPITLRMTIRGPGNLLDANPPELVSTRGFRTYTAQADTLDGETSSFEQVLVPQDTTVRTIPPVRFSYFDPQARRYQTLESQPIGLVVRPPQNLPRTKIVTGDQERSRVAAEEQLGQDIVYIKDDPGRLARRSAPWYRSVPFLLWQPVPLLLFVAAVWYERRRRRLSGDLRYARFTQAGKNARRSLATAEHVLTRGDRRAFYDIVSHTLQEYLAAKLDLPLGGVDADAVTSRGVPAEDTQRIRAFFTTCEQVRFAPGSADGDMRDILALAQDIIKRLERGRRPISSSSSTRAEIAERTL